MLVEKKDNKKIYALKSLRKDEIIGKDQVQHTKTERYVLEKVYLAINDAILNYELLTLIEQLPISC